MDDGSAGATTPGERTDLAFNPPGQAVIQRAEELYSRWRQRSFFRRGFPNRNEDRMWRRGPDDEATLAGCFKKLGPRWRMLHAIRLGDYGRDIDHLLIGPGGVYVVNSQHHASQTLCLGGDTLIVKGQRVHHVRDSRQEAALASRLLTAAVGFEVPVTGVVVILGDKRFDVRHQPKDAQVHVTTPHASVRWLKRRDVQWTSGRVDRIYETMRRSSSWVESSVVTSGTQPATR